MPPMRTASISSTAPATGAATGAAAGATPAGSTNASALAAAGAYSKPLKTERSHAENQERAYIAASRRSDRSLEARVESARRASEIHKKRTGRALRVTEQDVINEEMYEEEDDDLPTQYRHLTAHLHANSTDFNRRLAAYLGSHVAIRDALAQAIDSSYQSSGERAPALSQAQAQALQQQHPHLNTRLGNPWMNMDAEVAKRLEEYKASPAAFVANAYKTSAANTTPADAAQPRSSSRPLSSSHTSNIQTSTPKSAPQQSPTEVFQTPANTVFPEPMQSADFSNMASVGPFTTSLPQEAQMFLHHPNESTPLNGQKPAQRATSTGKPTHIDLPFSGIGQTLAPAQLDTSGMDDFAFPQSSPTGNDYLFSAGGEQYDLDASGTPHWNDRSSTFDFTISQEPSKETWDTFVNMPSFDEHT